MAFLFVDHPITVNPSFAFIVGKETVHPDDTFDVATEHEVFEFDIDAAPLESNVAVNVVVNVLPPLQALVDFVYFAPVPLQ